MPKRAQNGRFISKQKDDIETEEEDFLKEIKGFLKTLYRFWRLVPLLIVFYLLWNFFSIDSKLSDPKMEICDSPVVNLTMKAGENSKNTNSQFK